MVEGRLWMVGEKDDPLYTLVFMIKVNVVLVVKTIYSANLFTD